MGYIRHHAIICTSFSKSDAEQARQKAIEIGCQVTDVVVSPINGYATFVVAPDGSKEGWTGSDVGDERRTKFVAWLRSQDPDAVDSLYVRWAEVQYGDDNDECLVTRHDADKEGPYGRETVE